MNEYWLVLNLLKLQVFGLIDADVITSQIITSNIRINLLAITKKFECERSRPPVQLVELHWWTEYEVG
ncbi:MAG: hypothetical protein D6B25_19735 [Desulfobulbaceae bacterium]|nr:MAG: hypothetical protein D6B25_19735 [Desulfobulbaceae bacterium]